MHEAAVTTSANNGHPLTTPDPRGWHDPDAAKLESYTTTPFAPLQKRQPSPGTHWRMNTNGQLVNAAADPEWALADEIARLKIGEDGPDDIAIRTPPKSLLASQLAETSPLDSASIPSVNSSPLASDHIGVSHSRGSSTDSSDQSSVASNTMIPPPPTEAKERPHSFSGASISPAELRRLQNASGDEAQADWTNVAAEQPAYPSLAAAAAHRPHQPQLYDYRTGAAPNRDDLQIDYNIQQRNFSPLAQGSNVAGPPAFRPNNAVPTMPYRQPPRGFPQPGLVPSPTALGYPVPNSQQQLYDIMSHDSHVSRVQQQLGPFRAAHHHSASDPSSALRDAAALALLNGTMPAFPGGIFPQAMGPPPMYPAQFYPAQDAYRPDVAQAMAARIQAQYTGPYGGVMPPAMAMTDGSLSPSSTGQGPSANNRKLGLYKTELCRSWEEKGSCRYGAKCQFAHGEDELRNVARHPKYKTEICRTFWVSGSCPYGKRCCFIHTEVPPSGAAGSGTPGEPAPPPPRSTDGRARSQSTNSDPTEGSVSLLTRIAKREPAPVATPTSEATPTTASTFQFTRPPTGSLRVDTSVDTSASLKQNKSAYPTFATNGVLIHPPDRLTVKSPAPVTAGPDFGRQLNSRLEIVGYNNQRSTKAATPSNSNVRHSFTGSDGDGSFSPSPPTSGHSPFALPSGESTSGGGRANGHVRAGSAGNWGSFSRSSHLTGNYGQSSPSTESPSNAPWSTAELAVGSSRLNEKAWA